jgi:benzoyl-CoA reductase subunit C
MWRPYKLHDTSRPLLAQELKRLLNALEEFTGNKITPDQLLNSIAIYNQSRAMMRQLNQLRSDYPGIISAADMVHVVTSSMLIPREEHNQLLAELLSAIDTTQLPVVNRIRVVAAGHPCDPPEDELLNLIEEQGLVIIDDDFFTGGRYFAEDIKADGDPIDALVDYYMNSTPCSTYHYADDWRREITQTSPYAEYIIDKVKKGQAAGVVILRLMYCDPLDLEFVLLKNRLNQENIPYVSIFTESGPGAFEATRTRIQAFMESL